MENYELMLTAEASENIDETIALLIAAAQDIATASEQDFDKIKSKKWYKRLWELVTFSKDNQMIQARGVSNLAKLNEIAMKAIVLISKQSKQTAELVCESLKEIQKLEQDVEVLHDQQAKIAETILAIRRGFQTEERFDELSENQRDIIFAVMYEYSGIESNEYTQKLLRTLRKSSRGTYDKISYELIESELNPAAQKMLYNLIQGYSLLLHNEYADENHNVFEYFALSPKTKSKIKDYVYSEILKYGEEGYIGLFEVVTSDDDFCVFDEYIDWFFAEEEGNAEEDVPEIERIELNHILNIAPGQTLSYKYKEIHMGSLINCSGRLELDNCVIIYNEKSDADEITLNDGAKLSATNCTFVCKGVDENAFITLTDNCTTIFDKCIFVDCVYFIKADYCSSSIIIDNCEIYNCMTFAECHGVKSFELCNSKITADENFAWQKKKLARTLFQSYTEKFYIDNVVVSNSNPDFGWSCFDLSGGSVRNSSFFGMYGEAVRADNIENCVFDNCKGGLNIVSTIGCFSTNEKSIKSCVFDNCTDIIIADDNTTITQCKFVSCYDSLIHSATAGTGIDISYCEFINYRNQTIDRNQGCDTSDPIAGICLYVDRKSRNSTIKKCIFDGVDINEGFLIKPSISGKLSGSAIRLTDCDFRNCSTKRQSGKIIKTFGYYYGLFDKLHNELAVIVERCRGLDSVKRHGVGICTDHAVLGSFVRTKSKAGAAASSIAVGIVGGPIVGTTTAIINAIVKTRQKDEALSFAAKKE